MENFAQVIKAKTIDLGGFVVITDDADVQISVDRILKIISEEVS